MLLLLPNSLLILIWVLQMETVAVLLLLLLLLLLPLLLLLLPLLLPLLQLPLLPLLPLLQLHRPQRLPQPTPRHQWLLKERLLRLQQPLSLHHWLRLKTPATAPVLALVLVLAPVLALAPGQLPPFRLLRQPHALPLLLLLLPPLPLPLLRNNRTRSTPCVCLRWNRHLPPLRRPPTSRSRTLWTRIPNARRST